ncbi:MAG TPA: hypothetical protein PKD07_20225 [Microthrixaceae bacterium]|nr:hypothetical protein [Microthrixaceae bacterium]
MDLGSHLGDDWPDGSEEFAHHLASWLEKYGSLIDALVAGRDAGQQHAVHTLLTSAPLAE